MLANYLFTCTEFYLSSCQRSDKRRNSQARPLTRLEPEQQREAWQGGGDKTAAVALQGVDQLADVKPGANSAYGWSRAVMDTVRTWHSSRVTLTPVRDHGR